MSSCNSPAATPSGRLSRSQRISPSPRRASRDSVTLTGSGLGSSIATQGRRGPVSPSVNSGSVYGSPSLQISQVSPYVDTTRSPRTRGELLGSSELFSPVLSLPSDRELSDFDHEGLAPTAAPIQLADLDGSQTDSPIDAEQADPIVQMTPIASRNLGQTPTACAPDLESDSARSDDDPELVDMLRATRHLTPSVNHITPTVPRTTHTAAVTPPPAIVSPKLAPPESDAVTKDPADNPNLPPGYVELGYANIATNAELCRVEVRTQIARRTVPINPIVQRAIDARIDVIQKRVDERRQQEILRHQQTEARIRNRSEVFSPSHTFRCSDVALETAKQRSEEARLTIVRNAEARERERMGIAYVHSPTSSLLNTARGIPRQSTAPVANSPRNRQGFTQSAPVTRMNTPRMRTVSKRLGSESQREATGGTAPAPNEENAETVHE